MSFRHEEPVLRSLGLCDQSTPSGVRVTTEPGLKRHWPITQCNLPGRNAKNIVAAVQLDGEIRVGDGDIAKRSHHGNRVMPRRHVVPATLGEVVVLHGQFR